MSKQNGNEAKMQVLCGFRKGVQKNYTQNKTPGGWQADREQADGWRRSSFFMAIIPENKLQEKRLKKLLGEDYYTKPALRLTLGKLQGVQAVDEMDNGRSVEWADLETERERKIAITYFWRGVDQAQKWMRGGIL